MVKDIHGEPGAISQAAISYSLKAIIWIISHALQEKVKRVCLAIKRLIVCFFVLFIVSKLTPFSQPLSLLAWGGS